MVLLLATLLALTATVRTVQERRGGHSRGPGRRTLTVVAGGALATAVLAVALGQWALLVAGVVPAGVCGAYAVRDRSA